MLNPYSADRVLAKGVVQVIEATTSYMIWAHHTVKRASEYLYRMEHICLWDRRHIDLEWDGLCSHNPLSEALAHTLLTREQAEISAAEVAGAMCTIQ
jgi:hypothetical protein